MCPLQRLQAVLRYTVFHMVTRERLTLITSWPDDLPSGNQKRFWRNPVKQAGQTNWIVDAHGYGKRFIVHADELLTAFVELRRAVHQLPVNLAHDATRRLTVPHRWVLGVKHAIRQPAAVTTSHTPPVQGVRSHRDAWSGRPASCS